MSFDRAWVRSFPSLPIALSSLLIVLAPLHLLAQTEVTVGQTTGNVYYTANTPMYNSSSAPVAVLSQSVCIYMASEITTANGNVPFAALLDQISLMNGAPATSTATGRVVIHLKHTASTTVPAGNSYAAELIDATEVLDTPAITLAGGNESWFDFTFDVPFAYNGTDNLMVLWSWERDALAPFSEYTSWKYDDGDFPGDQCRTWNGSTYPLTNTFIGDDRPVVRLRGSVITQIAEAGAGERFFLYPNPAEDRFTIPGATRTDLVRLRDTAGRIVAQDAGPEVGISALPAGLYLVELITAGRTRAIGRLTKQ